MNHRATLILVATTLFWGGNALAGKLAVGHVSPMLLTALRWVFALALVAALGRRRLVADWPVLRGQVWLVAALGFLGFTLFNVALYSALNYTSVINASIEQAGIPMVIFLGNFLLYRLRVTPLQIAGSVLSIVGVALTASHGEPARLLALDLNGGDALMLLAVVVYSAYTILLRYKPAVHWLSLLVVLCLGAAASALPFLAWEFAAGAMVVPDATGWAIVAYTVIFPSLLSQALYIRGVELIGANRAGLFINLVPVFGTLLSILILREPFRLYHALAVLLVFGGIGLAELGGRKPAALPDRAAPGA